jgi:predicted HTH transcriptional regulator
MAEHESIERRLDLLIALTRIGVADALDRQRRAVRDDPVSFEIVRAAAEPVGAGQLKEHVRTATGQSKATVERRLADLVSTGALARHGSGNQITYRSTGLFDL